MHNTYLYYFLLSLSRSILCMCVVDILGKFSGMLQGLSKFAGIVMKAFTKVKQVFMVICKNVISSLSLPILPNLTNVISDRSWTFRVWLIYINPFIYCKVTKMYKKTPYCTLWTSVFSRSCSTQRIWKLLMSLCTMTAKEFHFDQLSHHICANHCCRRHCMTRQMLSIIMVLLADVGGRGWPIIRIGHHELRPSLGPLHNP